MILERLLEKIVRSISKLFEFLSIFHSDNPKTRMYRNIDRSTKLFGKRIDRCRRMRMKMVLKQPRSLSKPYFLAVPHANEVSIS